MGLLTTLHRLNMASFPCSNVEGCTSSLINSRNIHLLCFNTIHLKIMMHLWICVPAYVSVMLSNKILSSELYCKQAHCYRMLSAKQWFLTLLNQLNNSETLHILVSRRIKLTVALNWVKLLNYCATTCAVIWFSRSLRVTTWMLSDYRT